MNCKPNELAMVTRNTRNHPCVAKDLGRPVTTLISIRDLLTDEVGWIVNGGPDECPHCHGYRAGYLDADLTPVNPPPASENERVATEKPVPAEVTS